MPSMASIQWSWSYATILLAVLIVVAFAGTWIQRKIRFRRHVSAILHIFQRVSSECKVSEEEKNCDTSRDIEELAETILPLKQTSQYEAVIIKAGKIHEPQHDEIRHQTEETAHSKYVTSNAKNESFNRPTSDVPAGYEKMWPSRPRHYSHSGEVRINEETMAVNRVKRSKSCLERGAKREIDSVSSDAYSYTPMKPICNDRKHSLGYEVPKQLYTKAYDVLPFRDPICNSREEKRKMDNFYEEIPITALDRKPTIAAKLKIPAKRFKSVANALRIGKWWNDKRKRHIV